MSLQPWLKVLLKNIREHDIQLSRSCDMLNKTIKEW
jgi:hypothetical protein